MTTYNYERLWFDEVSTEGSFPDGRLPMEVILEDDHGEDYVWTPKWEEIQQLYATAERIEEANGAKDLDQLIALQKFSEPTLKRLAKCINHHTSSSGLETVFGDESTRGSTDREEVDEIFVEAEVDPPEYPKAYNMADRWKFIRDRLRELNEEDYRTVVELIEILVHRNRHIDAEERRRTLIEEMNKALSYENMEITLDGKVDTIGQ